MGEFLADRKQHGHRARGYGSVHKLATLLGWSWRRVQRALEELDHSPYFVVDFQRCTVRPKIICLLNHMRSEYTFARGRVTATNRTTAPASP